MKQGILNLVLILSVFILTNQSLSQPLTFSEEFIEIKIYDDYAEVFGTYIFKNNSSHLIKNTLYYPFPVDDSFPFPDKIKVYDANNNQLHFTELSSGIYFTLAVTPDSSAMIKVYYRQKLNSQKMKYILTTTKQWKHPLEKGEYVISIPDEFKIEKLSLIPDKYESKSSRIIFYISKENFMPEDDIIISWQRSKK